MSKQDVVQELTEAAAGLDLEPAEDKPVWSPCRKEATRNVRNLGAMANEKFLDVREQMKPYKQIDPIGFRAVEAEYKSPSRQRKLKEGGYV